MSKDTKEMRPVPTSPRLPRVMTNTALTGTTYDIGGSQQFVAGV